MDDPTRRRCCQQRDEISRPPPRRVEHDIGYIIRSRDNPRQIANGSVREHERCAGKFPRKLNNARAKLIHTSPGVNENWRVRIVRNPCSFDGDLILHPKSFGTRMPLKPDCSSLDP
jgi:hypothetical protein